MVYEEVQNLSYVSGQYTIFVGDSVGFRDGEYVGLQVGDQDGATVGETEGMVVGP